MSLYHFLTPSIHVWFIMYTMYQFNSSQYILHKPNTYIRVAYLRSFDLREDTIKKPWRALGSPPYPGLGVDKSLFLFAPAGLFSREAVR